MKNTLDKSTPDKKYAVLEYAGCILIPDYSIQSVRHICMPTKPSASFVAHDKTSASAYFPIKGRLI